MVLMLSFASAPLLLSGAGAANDTVTSQSLQTSRSSQSWFAPTGKTSTTARWERSLSAAPPLEGCISCHGKIEPMHKYGATESLDQLKDGKDAVGLTCHHLSWRQPQRSQGQ